jgi:hypothetical protein
MTMPSPPTAARADAIASVADCRASSPSEKYPQVIVRTVEVRHVESVCRIVIGEQRPRALMPADASMSEPRIRRCNQNGVPSHAGSEPQAE